MIIAPRRGKRPHEIAPPECLSSQKKKTCAFCSPRIEKEKAFQTVGGRKWRIKVLENKFPAVTLTNPRAYGKQEIIVETPDHGLELEDLSERQIADIFRVYSDRTEAISKNKKIEYILIFKNNGGIAGASLAHSHSQIFATQFLPPHLGDKCQKVQDYKLRHGRCVFCDVIRKESRGPRRVFHGRHVVAFAPYASMHNYEVWILPRRHIDNISDLNDKERLEWARVLKKILRQISKLGLPYNFYFHQVVYDEDQHLYMKITPRGSVWAGVEIGSGLIINPVAPEEAAKFYRKAF